MHGECMPDSRAGCRRLCPNRTDAVPTPTAEACFMSCQGKHKTRKRSGDVFKVKWFDNIRYHLHHPTSSFHLPTILTLSLDPRLRRIRIEHSVPMVPSVAMQPLELCSSRRIQANLGTTGMTVVWQWDPCSAFSVSHLTAKSTARWYFAPIGRVMGFGPVDPEQRRLAFRAQSGGHRNQEVASGLVTHDQSYFTVGLRPGNLQTAQLNTKPPHYTKLSKADYVTLYPIQYHTYEKNQRTC